MGWRGISNGELLDRAEAERFDLVIVADKNLRHQQNLAKRRIAILELWHDIIMRTIVDLPQEQIRKLALFCRREKISRTEAVRRAVDRFLRGSSASDLRAFFGACKTRGNISRHVATLRRQWSDRKPAREGFRS